MEANVRTDSREFWGKTRIFYLFQKCQQNFRSELEGKKFRQQRDPEIHQSMTETFI